MRHKGVLFATLALLALVLPASALAATPPSITSSFTPKSIPSGGASKLSYTITNNDSSQALTGVAFTDALPVGLQVAQPNGASGNCGGGTLSAAPGSSTITLSGGTLTAGGTPGASCTVSAIVTSSTPGVLKNSSGKVSSNEDGAGNSDTESLTVVAPPSISSTFTPSSIGVGGTSALSFTLTNPGTVKSLTGVGFTDTLPAGVQVDDPNGESAKCGSAATVTANPGSSTISLTGGKLAAGTSCTVSVAVTSGTPGAYKNSTGQVTSNEGGTGNSDTETVTVIAAPTITLLAPIDGSTFARGEKVRAHYTCLEAPGGPGISDCEGDSPSGARIDTSTPGAHTFTVTAISADGLVIDQTVSYTVVSSITHLLVGPGHAISFRLEVPRAGRVAVLEYRSVSGSSSSHETLLGQTHAKVPHPGTDALTIDPSAGGRRYLSHARARAETIVLTLKVTFAPAHGRARSVAVDVPLTP